MPACDGVRVDSTWLKDHIASKLAPTGVSKNPESRGAEVNVWRAGLPALGCEAVAKPITVFYLTHRDHWF